MKSIRKQAAKELLGIANHYELKQRKFLKGIKYTNDSAHCIGHAHNYSVKLIN